MFDLIGEFVAVSAGVASLDNPFDFENAMWRIFDKFGFWKISFDAIKLCWKSKKKWNLLLFASIAAVDFSLGAVALFGGYYALFFVPYLAMFFAVLWAWEKVLAAAYPLPTKTVPDYVRWHSQDRRFLRFFLWRQECTKHSVTPDKEMLKKVIAIAKAQQDVWEVKWGLADIVKKAGASLVLWAVFVFPFSLLVGDKTTQTYLSVLAHARSTYSQNELTAFIWGLFTIVVFLFWALAVSPTTTTKERKEYVLFLTWWGEGLER